MKKNLIFFRDFTNPMLPKTMGELKPGQQQQDPYSSGGPPQQQDYYNPPPPQQQQHQPPPPHHGNYPPPPPRGGGNFFTEKKIRTNSHLKIFFHPPQLTNSLEKIFLPPKKKLFTLTNSH